MEKSTLIRGTFALPENIIELRKVYIHLWIDRDVKLMYTEWLLKPTEEEYREACELCVKMVKESAVECWIADSKLLAGLPTSVQRPILQQTAPGLVGSSLKKLARIIEKDSHSIFMFEDISNRLKDSFGSTIEVEQFISFEDAADWIGMIRG